MTATTVAMHLGADHAEGAILSRPDSVFQRLIEARPAGAALILGLGRAKRMIATSAGETALAVLIQERAGPGALSALIAQNFILLRRQLRAPLGIGFFDLELLRSPRRRSPQPAKSGKAEQARDSGKQDTAFNHGGLRESVIADRSPSNTIATCRSYTD